MIRIILTKTESGYYLDTMDISRPGSLDARTVPDYASALKAIADTLDGWHSEQGDTIE